MSAIPGAAAGGWILGRYWAQVSPSGLSTAAHGTKEDFSGSASEFCYISAPSALELPERRLWTSGVSLYYHVTSTRTKGKGSKLHQGRFISILGTISSWKGFHWNRLPRAVVGSPSLQRAPKTCSCDAPSISCRALPSPGSHTSAWETLPTAQEKPGAVSKPLPLPEIPGRE